MLESAITRFKEFRAKLYDSFPNRPEALLELMDTIAGNTRANSPVALSLSPLFSRCYSSLHDAVDNFYSADDHKNTKESICCHLNQSSQDTQREPNISTNFQSIAQQEGQTMPSDEKQDGQGPVDQRTKSRIKRLRLLADFLPNPTTHLFHLLVTDATSLPRPFAKTLEDRHIVYAPNPTPGNKPIAVGHKYSTIAILPEKNGPSAPPWAIPISIERIPSCQTDSFIASKQIHKLFAGADLPFKNNLTVNVADSLYCTVPFLGLVGDIDNLVTIVRCPSNRVFYFPPDQTEPKGKGHPVWFGQKFDMHNQDTWGNPDLTIEHKVSMMSGKNVTLELTVWDDMLMRGKRKIPMHNDPFTLVYCRLLNEDGSQVFSRPLWLIVFGKRRMEISPVDAWQCYQQRYDIEHFFRFGKNHLLMGRYQTSILEHEENWCEIVGLAYFQLWVASPLAISLPNPWERYSVPKKDSPLPTPSMTQRSFEGIIRQVEAQLPPPKLRGKSPGRLPGQSQSQRSQLKVIFKGSERRKKKAA